MRKGWSKGVVMVEVLLFTVISVVLAVLTATMVVLTQVSAAIEEATPPVPVEALLADLVLLGPYTYNIDCTNQEVVFHARSINTECAVEVSFRDGVVRKTPVCYGTSAGTIEGIESYGVLTLEQVAGAVLLVPVKNFVAEPLDSGGCRLTFQTSADGTKTMTFYPFQ